MMFSSKYKPDITKAYGQAGLNAEAGKVFFPIIDRVKSLHFIS